MRVMAIAKRIMRQVASDPRTIALLMVAPAALLALMSVVLNSGATRPTIAYEGLSEGLAASLAEEAVIVEARDEAEGLAMLERGEADAFLYYGEGDAPCLALEGSDPSIAALSTAKVQKAFLAFMESGADGAMPGMARIMQASLSRMRPETSWLHGGPDRTAFEAMAPLMMGFMIFFFIFILAGVSLLRERSSGTLERIFATPSARFDVVAGYMLGFGAFAAIQTLVIQSFLVWVLGVPIEGGFLDVLAVNLALCVSALSLGSLVSVAARNEFQIFQFIPVVIVPQILFSGILDLREAPAWVGWIGKAFPLTYAGEALKGIMIRGEGLGQALPEFLAVIGFAALFMALNALALRRRT
jgi:ABC-2 type transport system permease protein